MARAWFYNIPYHGHINPTLPLVRELVRRGDQVVYFAIPDFASRIEATGAEYRDYRASKAFEESRTVAHTIHTGGLVAEATYALLPEVLSSVQEERPDYLFFDMSAPWGNIASRRFDIPAIASFPHLPFYWRTILSDRRVFRKMLGSIRPGYGYWRRLQRLTKQIVKDYHLRKLNDVNVLSSSAETNIVFSSRYFQPYQVHFDSSYLYVGPVIETNRQEESIPLSKNGDKRLIYIAVGTVYEANLQFLRNCLRAFAGDRYEVIMSVGRAIDPAVFEPIPPNFTLAQYVPQLLILQQADVFITHGGMNSIAESVTYGVPMIVVPNTLEQAINAARVEQLGAGYYLAPNQLGVENLKRTVDRVLADTELSGGIQRIQNSFSEAGGVQRAAEAIEMFKQEHRLIGTKGP